MYTNKLATCFGFIFKIVYENQVLLYAVIPNGNLNIIFLFFVKHCHLKAAKTKY